MRNKSRMFSFRISERDYMLIQSKAEKSKLSMTAYITNSAINKQIVVINGLDETIKELKNIGRNLNQLTILCNMGKIQSLELNELKNQFRDVYNTLLEIQSNKI